MTIPPHNTHVSYIFLETWDKIKFIGDAYNHHDVHQEHQEPSGMSLKCYISHPTLGRFLMTIPPHNTNVSYISGDL